ncbi:hypothetical protein MTR67_018213 [Solanum verrucosum]|uniref:Gag-pol polyprotein n=1 Tax=Solanum verrucosum TaxID=315347 RepID=A0AAF0QM16_SOLVR|nr:hypothetical protein MTR67_018213 [Solanum verrucosum]
MNTRTNNARRAGEENVNEAVPPQAPQNAQVPIEEGAMSNVEIRSAIHNLTQVLATQVAGDARVQVNSNASTTVSRIRDFTRMIPPTFFVSKVEEYLQGFIDEVFKVLEVMGVSSQEKSELDAYKLKDVAQVWVQVKSNASTTASRIRDFTRMNSPTFFASKVEEDPQRFIDELFKVLEAMGVSSQEKAELVAYQLKDVAQVWYGQWLHLRQVLTLSFRCGSRTLDSM